MINRENVNILVVDDDKNLTEILRDYLTNIGYSVEEANDGLEGLDKFRKGAFQLVLADLKMPRMGGVELLKHIKQLDPQALVLILTGYGSIRSAVEAIRDGAYDYLTKPVKLQELEATIRRALKGRDSMRDLEAFRGLTLCLILSLPFWLILGIVFVVKYFMK